MASTRDAFQTDPTNPSLAWLTDAASVYSWSPTGERLAIVPRSSRGRRAARCYDLRSRQRVATLRTEGWVRELSLASDDALWVFTNSGDGGVMATCYSLPQGEVVTRVALPAPAGGGESSLFAAPTGDGKAIFVRAMNAPDAREGWRACVLGIDGDPALRATVPAADATGSRISDCALRPKGDVLATLDEARRVHLVEAATGRVVGGPIEASASASRLNWVGDETLSVVGSGSLDLIDASAGRRRAALRPRGGRASGWEARIERIAVHPERAHILVVERRSLQLDDSSRGASLAEVWDVNARTGRVDDVLIAHDDNHDLSRGLSASWTGRGLDVLELHAYYPNGDTEQNPVSLMLHRRSGGGWQEDMVLSTELGTARTPIGLLDVPGRKWIAPCCALEGGGLRIGLLDLAAAYR